MPKVCRSMRKDVDGRPVIDSTGKGLGVRISPVNGRTDVDVDPAGNVVINGKGLSVSPSWRDLPPFLIPQRLRSRFPKARGNNVMYCFSAGQGPFADGPIFEDLALVRDTPTHGLITPSGVVSAGDYQAAPAKTREEWVEDEA